MRDFDDNLGCRFLKRFCFILRIGPSVVQKSHEAIWVYAGLENFYGSSANNCVLKNTDYIKDGYLSIN